MTTAPGLPDFKAAPRVDDRYEWLRPFVASGPVLDLGCIDERHPERIADSLHARLKRLNPELIGADVDREAIAQVERLGFEVRWAEAQSSHLGGPYAAIVAGELIEHLDDPGRFLDNAHRALAPDGLLLLTTPNPFYANQFAKILKHGAPQVHAQHRAWFDPQTLAVLLGSRGFRIRELVWLKPSAGFLRKTLARWRPYWCPGFAVAAGRAGDQDTRR